MEKYERNIKHNFEKITNPKHKKDIKEYLEIRETIDKVKKSTQENDSFALRKFDRFKLIPPSGTLVLITRQVGQFNSSKP